MDKQEFRRKMAEIRARQSAQHPLNRLTRRARFTPEQIAAWKEGNRKRGAAFAAVWRASSLGNPEDYVKYLEAHAPCAVGVFLKAMRNPQAQVEYCEKKGYILGKDYVKLEGKVGEEYAAAVFFNARQAAGRMIGYAKSR